MRSVAKHAVFRVLAAAKINGLCLGCLKGLGRELTALVAAITKRLIFTLSARTPVIGFSGGNLNGIRRFLCNGWFHIHSLIVSSIV